MIFIMLSYLSAFILGMLVMGIFWHNSWEEMIKKETKTSRTLHKTLDHRNNQLAQMMRLIDDLGGDEMHRQAQEIFEW